MVAEVDRNLLATLCRLSPSLTGRRSGVIASSDRDVLPGHRVATQPGATPLKRCKLDYVDRKTIFGPSEDEFCKSPQRAVNAANRDLKAITSRPCAPSSTGSLPAPSSTGSLPAPK